MSKIDLDLTIKYTEKILRNLALKKFWQVLLACKETARGLAGNQWTPRSAKNVTKKQLWDWAKVDSVDSDDDPFTGAERCNKFKK